MAIPKYKELYPNVLRILSDEKEHSIHEIDELISDELNLTEEERNEMLPRGNQKLIKNRVGWARSYLKKAGLIESKKRGFANITDLGLKEYNENPNLTENDLMKYPSFVDFVNGKLKDGIGKRETKPAVFDDSTPDEIMESTYKKINKDLSDSILESIYNNDPFFFEKLVVDLLLKNGIW